MREGLFSPPDGVKWSVLRAVDRYNDRILESGTGPKIRMDYPLIQQKLLTVCDRRARGFTSFFHRWPENRDQQAPVLLLHSKSPKNRTANHAPPRAFSEIQISPRKWDWPGGRLVQFANVDSVKSFPPMPISTVQILFCCLNNRA